MDLDEIRRLATTGIASFPPVALATAADWLWDFGETTGDARYCSLSRTIEMIASAFENLYDALPTSTLQAIDRILSERLPDVLDTALPSDGSALARLTREDVASALSTA